MSKAIVTGGAGFIGSHITDLLIERGYDVTVVDDLSSGSERNLNPKAKFHREDIRSRERLEAVFEKERPDHVLHQAAQINVRTSMKDPAYDAGINIIGAINVLECCRKYDVGKVVFASSGGAIYGEPEYMPADEKHPVSPLSPYGASKYCFEKYLELYRTTYGMSSTALRYSNVYGPRQDPLGEAGVVAIFANKLLTGEQPVIFGDGEQTRDFVYVGDVARANLAALETDTGSRAFNIGVGAETSVNELYEKIRALIPSDLQAVHGEAVTGEVRRIYLDISLARKELGWSPQVDLETGLSRTVEYFRPTTVRTR